MAPVDHPAVDTPGTEAPAADSPAHCHPAEQRTTSVQGAQATKPQLKISCAESPTPHSRKSGIRDCAPLSDRMEGESRNAPPTARRLLWTISDAVPRSMAQGAQQCMLNSSNVTSIFQCSLHRAACSSAFAWPACETERPVECNRHHVVRECQR